MKDKTLRGTAVALLVACCAAWSGPAAADFNRASEHYRKGEYAEALRELKPLVDAGDPAAMNGHGVAKDYKAAANMFRKSAEQGHPEGQRRWSYALRAGEGVGKDERLADQWLRRSATQGDAEAQNNLGVLYATGQGVARDDSQAIEWFRKAASQGQDDAQFNLGVFYANGRGTAQDDVQAFEWYRKAAEQGYLLAQYNLGVVYANGRGVAKNDEQAVEWYRKAAEQGYAAAQYSLGRGYADGRGVAKDDREAASWYRKAADQGHSVASTHLGYLHERGEGGQRQDYVEAVRLYEAAARQGEPYGQRNLAMMYREGLGVASDAVVAYAWANLAASADSPHPNAAEERDAMKAYMSKEVIAEGQRLAREWKPGKPLGKSKLQPVSAAAAKVAADIATLAKTLEARQPADHEGQFPARPEAKPGLVTCNTRCTNGDCYRTYGDGRKVRFQARQKWNPFNNQFEWDSGSC
jgi:hypothetical protein